MRLSKSYICVDREDHLAHLRFHNARGEWTVNEQRQQHVFYLYAYIYVSVSPKSDRGCLLSLSLRLCPRFVTGRSFAHISLGGESSLATAKSQRVFLGHFQIKLSSHVHFGTSTIGSTPDTFRDGIYKKHFSEIKVPILSLAAFILIFKCREK